MKPKVNIICPKCGGTFLRYAQSIKQIIKKSGFWWCQGCTNTTRNKARAKPIGSTWISNKGYIFEKTASGWIQQHRLVAAKKIGRPLLPNEVAHHDNEVKTDNSPSNLEVKLHGEHTREHHTGSKRSAAARKNIKAGAYSRPSSLPDKTVHLIRERVLKNGEVQRQVAIDLNLPAMVVNNIVRGKTYTHVIS